MAFPVLGRQVHHAVSARHRGRYPWGQPPTTRGRRRVVLVIMTLLLIVLVGLVLLAILGAAALAGMPVRAL